MSVESQGFTEGYKRFYFQDIQAFIIRRTKTALIQNVILLGILALCCLLWLLISDAVGRAVAGASGGLILIALSLNLHRGPSVICHICTAVHVEELPSLKRLRTARKVIARLKPLIEQAQGTLSPDTIQSAASAVSAGTRPQPSPMQPGEALTHNDGRWHQALFLLLLLKAGMTAAGYYRNSPVVGVANMLGVLAIGTVAIIAIVRQQHTDITEGIRHLTTAAIVYVGINIIAGYILLITAIMEHPRPIRTQWDTFRLLAETSPQSSVLGTVVLGGLFLLGSGLGVSGLVLVHQFRKRTYLHSGATREPAAPAVAEGTK
ncbi:MAG TPA: hypothetical protein VMV72_08090 [Verrucomicrobiae bacterium]|nr:hypothetical protein [Verrucomicrobiae bacterium]